MVVKELIERLKQCNKYAIVAVEVSDDPLANSVVEYTRGCESYVYIADSVKEIEEDMKNNKFTEEIR